MTIFGWDMSHYDEPGIGSAVAEGISFITHKAGGDSNDPELSVWWSGVKGDAIAGRILAGAYWVLYPGGPSARADAFVARLDAACPGWRNVPFLLQVDCEKWNGDPNTMPHKADIEAFCDRLASRMPKLRPIVYAPSWAYGGTLAGLSYPLWASSYVTGSGSFKSLYPGNDSSRWGAYSGQAPAILQYSSSARIAGQSTCDANAYRGTLAQLTALAAPGWSDMATLDADDLANIARAVWNQDFIPAPDGSTNADGTPNSTWAGYQYARNTYVEAKSAHLRADDAMAQLAALSAQVAALQAPDPNVLALAIEQAVAKAVAAIAAQITTPTA